MSHMGEYMMKEDLFTSMSALIISGNFKLPEKQEVVETNSLHGRFLGEDVAQLLTSGILIVPITGVTMMKESKHGGTSTIRTRSLIREAKLDPTVKGIMLKMRTPGGHVEGNHVLAQELSDFAQVKPLFTHTEEMMASAGVWIGLQGSRISASPMATVGSLGTMMTIFDFSKKFEKDGVRAIVISTGKFKGAGSFGSEVTPEQEKFFENRVNELNAFFKKAVMESRGFDQAKTDILFDGSFGLAQKALDDGLIDNIESFDEALAALEAQIKTGELPTRESVSAQIKENSTKNNNSVDEDMLVNATMDEQIKQNAEKEHEEMDEIKTIAGLKTKYPVLCADLESASASTAVKGEKARVKGFTTFAKVDPLAAINGIEGDEEISSSEQAVLAAKLVAMEGDEALQQSLIDDSTKKKVPDTTGSQTNSTEADEVAKIVADAENFN